MYIFSFQYQFTLNWIEDNFYYLIGVHDQFHHAMSSPDAYSLTNGGMTYTGAV